MRSGPVRKAWIASAAAALACLVAAPSASAAIGFGPGLSAQPPPPPVLHAEFDGHNGSKRSSDVAADVEGCGANGGPNGGGNGAKPTAKVKLRRSKSAHPRMKVKVKAGISGLRKMKLKLPRQLRLAGGRDFKRGAKASEGKLRAGKRKLKLKSDEGVVEFKVRVGRHGLDRVKPIKKGKRLKFPITVTDVGGDKTKIKAKAKAR